MQKGEALQQVGIVGGFWVEADAQIRVNGEGHRLVKQAVAELLASAEKLDEMVNGRGHGEQ